MQTWVPSGLVWQELPGYGVVVDVGAVVVVARGVVAGAVAAVARGAVVTGGTVVTGAVVVVGPDVVGATVVGAVVGAADVVVDCAVPPPEPHAEALNSAARAAADATAS